MAVAARVWLLEKHRMGVKRAGRGIMDKLVAGLVVLAVSGVSILAYQHPAAYSKLSTFLVVGLACVLLGVAVWNSAVSLTYSKLVKHLPMATWEEASKEIEALKVTIPWIVGFVLAQLYMLFLEFGLPTLLRE
jgi:hypothetical protein